MHFCGVFCGIRCNTYVKRQWLDPIEKCTLLVSEVKNWVSSSLTSANQSHVAHLLLEMFWGPWSKTGLTCMISARWSPTKSQNPSEQYTAQCAWKWNTHPIIHFQNIYLALRAHLLDNLEGLKHFPGQNLNLQGISGQNNVHFKSYLDCLKLI